MNKREVNVVFRFALGIEAFVGAPRRERLPKARPPDSYREGNAQKIRYINIFP